MAAAFLVGRLSRMEETVRVYNSDKTEENEKEMKFINLKQFRSERELSQKQLVKDTGLSQSTVSYIENGYQEVSELHLEILRKTYPGIKFEDYVYMSESYPYAVVKKESDILCNRNFQGDWSSPTAVDKIGSTPILLKIGRVSMAFDGTLYLDRNDGTFKKLGYHIIGASKLNDGSIVARLIEETWFDDEIYEDFKRCYHIACRVSGIEPVAQIKSRYNF